MKRIQSMESSDIDRFRKMLLIGRNISLAKKSKYSMPPPTQGKANSSSNSSLNLQDQWNILSPTQQAILTLQASNSEEQQNHLQYQLWMQQQQQHHQQMMMMAVAPPFPYYSAGAGSGGGGVAGTMVQPTTMPMGIPQHSTEPQTNNSLINQHYQHQPQTNQSGWKGRNPVNNAATVAAYNVSATSYSHPDSSQKESKRGGANARGRGGKGKDRPHPYNSPGREARKDFYNFEEHDAKVSVRCDPCNMKFITQFTYDAHLHAHKQCPHCLFSALSKPLSVHVSQMHSQGSRIEASEGSINSPCKFFLKGKCKKMLECPYLHIVPASSSSSSLYLQNQQQPQQQPDDFKKEATLLSLPPHRQQAHQLYVGADPHLQLPTIASTNVESPPEEVSDYLAARRNRYPSHDRVAPTQQEEKIHIPTINQSCRFYWKGTCKKMSECPYMHIASHSKVQPQNNAAASASGATSNNRELQQSSVIPEKDTTGVLPLTNEEQQLLDAIKYIVKEHAL